MYSLSDSLTKSAIGHALREWSYFFYFSALMLAGVFFFSLRFHLRLTGDDGGEMWYDYKGLSWGLSFIVPEKNVS